MELNQKVADFTLQTDENKSASLSDFAGKPVVLFFYPRADTPGCTIEACGFRDTFKKLQAAGAVVLGISRDTPKAQAKFREKYNLPYTLLADVDEKVCNQFGVMKEKNMYGKKVWGIERTTFVIGPDQTLLHIFPKGDARRPRGRGVGPDHGMEEGTQVKPGSNGKANVQDRMPGRMVPRAFFERPPEQVAPRLLGKMLARIGLAAGCWPGESSRSRPIWAHTTIRPIPRPTRIAAPPRGTRCCLARPGMRTSMRFTAGTFAPTYPAKWRAGPAAYSCARWSHCLGRTTRVWPKWLGTGALRPAGQRDC